TAFFDSATTKTARKSAARRGDELREKRASIVTHRKAPFCLEMVGVARKEYWETADRATRVGRDAMAKYLGLAIMADTGARSSNVTGPVMDTGVNRGKVLYDHGVKCSDVELEVERLEEGEGGLLVMTGGPGLRSYLSRPEVMVDGYAKVHTLTIVFLTSKTTTDDTASLPARAELARTTDLETRALQDLCDWFRQNEGQQADDYILSRYSPEPGGQRRLMQRSDLTTIVKHVAELCHCDPKAFATSSGRRCFSTHCVANEMPAEERNQRGGWAANSQVPMQNYTTMTVNRGIMALGGNAFGLEHVQRLSRHRMSEYPVLRCVGLEVLEHCIRRTGGQGGKEACKQRGRGASSIAGVWGPGGQEEVEQGSRGRG
ncbi:hypothetical protein B484DRAFT_400288, partial [Ochromonadaceae sp. CCMP2298]